MSEHSPDALFGGLDGTESPAPLPDPSGRDGWRDAPELPPFTLPPLPNSRLMREAIAAALGEDPTGLVDQDPGAAPAPQPARPFSQPKGFPATLSPPTVSQPTAVQPTAVQANEAPVNNLTAPLPRPASGQRPPGGPRLIVPAPVPPAVPPPRGTGGLRLRYRPPLAAGSRKPVQLGDLRRRVGRQRSSLPIQPHSNGGAGLFFAISLILFLALAYGVITGIVEAIVRLLP